MMICTTHKKVLWISESEELGHASPPQLSIILSKLWQCDKEKTLWTGGQKQKGSQSSDSKNKTCIQIIQRNEYYESIVSLLITYSSISFYDHSTQHFSMAEFETQAAVLQNADNIQWQKPS